MMFLNAACLHRCIKFALKMEFCLFGTDFSAWNFLILIKIYGEKTNSSNTCRFSVFIPRRSVAFGTRKMFHVCTRGMEHSDHVISSIWLAAFFHFVNLPIFASSNLFCPQHSYMINGCTAIFTRAMSILFISSVYFSTEWLWFMGFLLL